MNRPPYSALLSAVALALAVGGGAVLAVGDEAGDNLYLSAGFAPDPRTVDLVLNARIDASAGIAPDCHGFIASERPDVAVYYNAGPFPLILSARAEEDMMLIVNARLSLLKLNVMPRKFVVMAMPPLPKSTLMLSVRMKTSIHSTAA